MRRFGTPVVAKVCVSETGLLDVVGRHSELRHVARFLEAVERGPAALALEGEPGIGKTTVWRAACAEAGRRAVPVLSCRPAEAEAKLAFASLVDLLEPLADDALAELPEPQRLGLEVALLRASPRGSAPTPRVVAAAVLSTLRLLSSSSPVVLAIDDVQWLDRATAAALAFAVRRLGDSRVGVLVAVRLGTAPRTDPLGLEQVRPETLERVRLGRLTLGSIHHVIRTRLGHVFPRPTLRRIARTSGGNPLFALELARMLLEGGVQDYLSEPLAVPDPLRALIDERIRRLPAGTLRALLPAAALSAPTLEVLAAAIGEDPTSSLIAAERAGVIETRDRDLRFAHPLLASAVYSAASPLARFELHRRLADVVGEPEERARHLALATSQPDERVAAALDAAAARAYERGALDTAAELQERAARLTPRQDGTAFRQRLSRAAEHGFRAGDRSHARALLEELLPGTSAGGERAHALRLLGEIRYNEDSLPDAIRLFEEALAHADRPLVRMPIRIGLANAHFASGDTAAALAQARCALDDGAGLDEPGALAEALACVVMFGFLTGDGIDHNKLSRAVALEDRSQLVDLLNLPSVLAAEMALFEGRLSEAQTAVCALRDWAIERGVESGLAYMMCDLAWLEWWRGDFAAAIKAADEALDLSAQTGSDTMGGLALVHRAMAFGLRGDVDAARVDLDEARRRLEPTGWLRGVFSIQATLGALELSLGETAAAQRALAPLIDVVEMAGILEPGVTRFVPDAIEALVGVGQLERAAALLAMFDSAANKHARTWAIAAAARCRSLLLTASGDLDGARAAAEDAAELSTRLEMPVDLARALISLGRIRRLGGQRRAARDALERALAILRKLGASQWVERAESELSRVPSRRRGVSDDLTPTEEHVAELAATGRTNREVAQALFVSPKTVEAALSRAYRKLGIHSRAELGALMAERSGGTGPAKT